MRSQAANNTGPASGVNGTPTGGGGATGTTAIIVITLKIEVQVAAQTQLITTQVVVVARRIPTKRIYTRRFSRRKRKRQIIHLFSIKEQLARGRSSTVIPSLKDLCSKRPKTLSLS
jgi:hypothetical protein